MYAFNQRYRNQTLLLIPMPPALRQQVNTKHSRIRHILSNNMWCSSSIMICDAVQVLAPLLSSTSPPPPPSKGPLIGNKLHRFSDDLYH